MITPLYVNKKRWVDSWIPNRVYLSNVVTVTQILCVIWAKVRQILDFFRLDSSKFGLPYPKSTEIHVWWFEKPIILLCPIIEQPNHLWPNLTSLHCWCKRFVYILFDNVQTVISAILFRLKAITKNSISLNHWPLKRS